MAVIGKINIHGHIGPSYIDKQGFLHKGTVLLDVIEQAESFPDATQYEIDVNSPGGFADIGDAIYNYLVSLKKNGKQLVTIQTGLIGSIATKIFLSGDRRIVDDRYRFWIHNPYLDNVSGDQDELREMAKSLEDTEKNLRKFYAEFTKITDEGLDGLMKNETGLSADQCIKFNFATEKKLVPAFNSINMQIKQPVKKTADRSFKDSLISWIESQLSTEKPKGVAPKGQTPGNEIKNLVVTLAEGAGSFWVEGEELTEGAAAFLLDSEGNPTTEPVADGDYPLNDGGSISIMDGKVSSITPAEGDSEDELEARINATVEKALQNIKNENEANVEAKILALKKEVRLGIQPKPAVLNGKGDKTEIAPIGQGISARLAEKIKRRHEQLNNIK